MSEADLIFEVGSEMLERFYYLHDNLVGELLNFHASSPEGLEQIECGHNVGKRPPQKPVATYTRISSV